MGWMPTVAVKQIMECVPGPVLAWMAIGGIMYTLGTWFLARDERVPFFHAVWHVFVIAGSACHYYAVLRYVAPWES
jgi:hemolysin III